MAVANPVEAERRRRESRWDAETRAQLESDLGVGSRHAGWGGGGAVDHSEAMKRARFASTPQGKQAQVRGGQAGFDKAFNAAYHGGAHPMEYGESFNQNDWGKYVASIGGNPYSRERYYAENPQQYSQLGAGRIDSGAQQQAKQKTQQDEMLQEYLASVEQAREEAKQANLARYREGHGELSTLRGRTLANVANLGRVEWDDTQESYERQLGDTLARLNRGGLTSSTSDEAFKSRSARELNRAGRQISESVLKNVANHDMQLTNNLVGFIERRNDVGPDLAEAQKLAEAFGASGGGEGFGQQQVPQQQAAQGRPPLNTPWGQAISASQNPNLAGVQKAGGGNNQNLQDQQAQFAQILAALAQQQQQGGQQQPQLPQMPQGLTPAQRREAERIRKRDARARARQWRDYLDAPDMNVPGALDTERAGQFFSGEQYA
jgi:hypothetical protein